MDSIGLQYLGRNQTGSAGFDATVGHSLPRLRERKTGRERQREREKAETYVLREREAERTQAGLDARQRSPNPNPKPHHFSVNAECDRDFNNMADDSNNMRTGKAHSRGRSWVRGWVREVWQKPVPTREV